MKKGLNVLFSLLLLASLVLPSSVTAATSKVTEKEEVHQQVLEQLGVGKNQVNALSVSKDKTNPKEDFEEDVLIVKYKSSISKSAHTKMGTTLVKKVGNLNYDIVKVNKGKSLEKVAEKYAERTDVVSVSRSARVQKLSVPDQKRDQMYHLDTLKVDSAQKLAGKNKVKVAVVDSGIDVKHPELKNKVTYNYSVQNPMKKGVPDLHGTHVAGIIASEKNNGVGGYGVNPNVSILSIDVFGHSWYATDYTVAEGILQAVKQKAQVINLSLGTYYPSPILEDAIQKAVEANITVVAAAGNGGDEMRLYPAAYQGVISVGATNSKNELAEFSTFGPTVDIVAPGEGIYNAAYDYDKKSSYMTLDGTSMATPMVTGVVSLLLSKNPNLKPHEIQYILNKTAKDLGAKGYDTTYGFGLVNPVSALKFDTKQIPKTTFLTEKQLSTKAKKITVKPSTSVTGQITKLYQTDWYRFDVKEDEYVQLLLKQKSKYDYMYDFYFFAKGDSEHLIKLKVDDQKRGGSEGSLFQAPLDGTIVVGVKDATKKYNEKASKTYTLTAEKFNELPTDGINKWNQVEIDGFPFNSKYDFGDLYFSKSPYVPPVQEEPQEPIEEEPIEDEPIEDEPIEDEPIENEPAEDEIIEEATDSDESNGEVATEDLETEESIQEETVVEETLEEGNEGTEEQLEDVPAEDLPSDETPAEDYPIEDDPYEEYPTEPETAWNSDYFTFTMPENDNGKPETVRVKTSSVPGIDIMLKVHAVYEEYWEEEDEFYREEYLEDYKDEFGFGSAEEITFNAYPGMTYIIEVTNDPTFEMWDWWGEPLTIDETRNYSSTIPYEISIESKTLPKDEDNFPNEEYEEEYEYSDDMFALSKEENKPLQSIRQEVTAAWHDEEDYINRIKEVALPHKEGKTSSGYFQYWGDEDWYSFTPTRNAFYRFTLNSEGITPIFNVFSLNELTGELEYISTNEGYDYENDRWTTQDTIHIGVKANRTYYLALSDINYRPSFYEYSFTSEFVRRTPVDKQEDNDSFEEARPISEGKISGNFAQTGDVDIFYFKPKSTAIYGFNVSPKTTTTLKDVPEQLVKQTDPDVVIIEDSNGNGKLDPEEEGNTMVFVNGWSAEEERGAFNGKKKAGYFIVLYNYLYEGSVLGYDFTLVNATAMADEDKGNKVKDNIPSKPVTIKASKAGNFTATGNMNVTSNKGDTDFFKIVVPNKRTYDVLLSVPTDLDGKITIYNSKGKKVTSKDVYGAGDAEKFSVSLKKGTYYVKVEDYHGNASISSYKLSMKKK
ncbi:S8 family serine peptidase [Bacillus alkalicellulosilyticus]|uniref:S8 family serine peptidase n=1 Tax=Alkalihalobacterium alkalicellulosilyticum TaxID=1912214 RepID=UPI0011172A68|nr:S8 family serine peptidase [Bacillus alkalicellulosilyticus]